MVCGTVVLGEVVSEVVDAWFPVHIELFLVATAAQPEKTHIHGL